MFWHPKTLQNLAMYNVFFIFGRFSIAGKLPKWPKIPFQYPLALRHPKNPRKMSKTPPYSGLGAKPFLGPPTPAKADIATAILTNVIEHLVLLLPPNKHAFTAKAVWADLPSPFYPHVHLEPVRPWWSELWLLGYQKTWWIWTHTMETGVEIHRNMFWKRLWLVEILWKHWETSWWIWTLVEIHCSTRISDEITREAPVTCENVGLQEAEFMFPLNWQQHIVSTGDFTVPWSVRRGTPSVPASARERWKSEVRPTFHRFTLW